MQSYLIKFQNLKRGATIAYEPVSNPLVLLWFSDIHNDIDRLRRVIQFRNKYDDYIDDTILTGDLAGLTYASLNPNILTLNGFDSFLKNVLNPNVFK